MVVNFDVDIFTQRIRETTALVKHAVNVKNEVQYLWDVVAKESDYLSQLQIKNLLFYSDDITQRVVQTVFETRTKVLSQIHMEDKEQLTYFRQGRLIAFFPAATFNDGTAEIVSRGFFNLVNYPPYSTWLYFVQSDDVETSGLSHLIAWIPPEYMDAGIMGLESSPDPSLCFMTDTNFETSYKSKLAEFDLLF